MCNTRFVVMASFLLVLGFSSLSSASAKVSSLAFQHDAGSSGRRSEPQRPLKPPFPNGPCGGTIVAIPPEDTFGIDAKLAGNPVLLPPRALYVWLPSDYHQSNDQDNDEQEQKRYPVLYCHDGQNAMEDSSSWTGASWRLAGALTRLKQRKMISQIPIVVMLPSAEGDFVPGVRRRHLEYGDMNNVFAQAHVDFVVETVKPLIDATFRTLVEPHHTFAIGSSLGGQASFHMLLRHPDVFGGVACMSPAFQPATLAAVVSDSNQQQELSLSNNHDYGATWWKDKRIYLDMGGDLNEEKVQWFDMMDHLTPKHWWNPGYFWLDTQLKPSLQAMLLALQLKKIPHSYTTFPGARHNERAWSQRIDRPLMHLFGPSDNAVTDN
uniref:Esterase n=1 Tax=Asterionellopsis glacialis TaxID=33640 RepID=A0A7S0KYE1_9STRA|mmetsp:Transcript_87/g.119  ORF Transcript_87/g.119 Transcript_87/m.119 type:complete len:379 (+) Transcript_87:195-1331(+)